MIFFAILYFLFQIVLYLGYPTNENLMLNLPRREEKKKIKTSHTRVWFYIQINSKYLLGIIVGRLGRYIEKPGSEKSFLK